MTGQPYSDESHWREVKKKPSFLNVWDSLFLFGFFCCAKIQKVKWNAIPFAQILYKFPEFFCDLDRAVLFFFQAGPAPHGKVILLPKHTIFCCFLAHRFKLWVSFRTWKNSTGMSWNVTFASKNDTKAHLRLPDSKNSSLKGGGRWRCFAWPAISWGVPRPVCVQNDYSLNNRTFDEVPLAQLDGLVFHEWKVRRVQNSVKARCFSF